MSGTKIVFDTNMAVNLLQTERSVPEILLGFEGMKLFVSVMTRLELLSKPNMSSAEEAKRQAFLDSVNVVPLNMAVQQETIRLRRTRRLKLPDAVIAATAVKLDAVLLSEDEHFAGLSWPGLVVQNAI
jgi:predicted nucleic acid-binding protein